MGTMQNEEEAARLYDKHAIMSQGLRALTNFEYRRNELIEIKKELELENGNVAQC